MLFKVDLPVTVTSSEMMTYLLLVFEVLVFELLFQVIVVVIINVIANASAKTYANAAIGIFQRVKVLPFTNNVIKLSIMLVAFMMIYIYVSTAVDKGTGICIKNSPGNRTNLKLVHDGH